MATAGRHARRWLTLALVSAFGCAAGQGRDVPLDQTPPRGGPGDATTGDEPDAVDEGGTTRGDAEPWGGESDESTDSGTSRDDEPEPERSCCEASSEAGCVTPEIEACVCAKDASCCEVAWRASCVELVEFLECGWCSPEPDNCCEPHGEPGCTDPVVEACVCAQDPVCCDEGWDFLCADIEAIDCGSCGPETVAGDCCSAHGDKGCADETVQACVCTNDSYCCAVAWDAQCVEEVTTYACGTC
jgi:hypothetical protein